MKFQCLNCKRQFVYAALKTVTTMVDDEFETTEYRCCPYCGSMDFDEIVEQKTQENITEVLDVSHGEVAELVKQGYRVHNIYSKNTIMVKVNENRGTE
jgi:DNA-directed RNA polymerase subunit RPC12/RpoP